MQMVLQGDTATPHGWEAEEVLLDPLQDEGVPSRLITQGGKAVRLFPNAPYKDPWRIWQWEQHQAHYEARFRANAVKRTRERQVAVLIDSIFRKGKS